MIEKLDHLSDTQLKKLFSKLTDSQLHSLNNRLAETVLFKTLFGRAVMRDPGGLADNSAALKSFFRDDYTVKDKINDSIFKFNSTAEIIAAAYVRGELPDYMVNSVGGLKSFINKIPSNIPTPQKIYKAAEEYLKNYKDLDKLLQFFVKKS